MDQHLEHDDMYIVAKSGHHCLRKTTVGWKFLIKWRDGREEWIPLKLLKETTPLKVVEFVTAEGISNEPAFCWWVPYTLRRHDRIISSVKSRVKRMSHKYGIELPTSIEHAFEIDRRNKDHF